MSTITERIRLSADIPFNIRKAFMNAGEPEEHIRAWVLLWRECAARAVMDALGYTGQTEADKHNSIMNEAQKWFRYSSEDVAEVFDLAGVNVDLVRGEVIKNLPLTKKLNKGTRSLRG